MKKWMGLLLLLHPLYKVYIAKTDTWNSIYNYKNFAPDKIKIVNGTGFTSVLLIIFGD
jgi:hypothetical protein